MSSKSVLFILFSFIFLFISCQDNRWEFNVNNLNKSKIIYVDFDKALYNFSRPKLESFISNYRADEILNYLCIKI